MFGFLRAASDAMKEGNRAGNMVLLLQRVVGRPLQSNEKQLAKAYFDSMNFSKEVNDHEIVISYIMFLIAANDDPSMIERPNLSPDAKGRLIEAIRSALGWGVLSLEEGPLSAKPFTATDQIVEFVARLRKHAGLD